MENNLDCSKYKNKDGVSCYRNSILAILQSLPIFSDHIMDIENFMEFHKKCEIEEKDVTRTITYQIFKLFNLSLDNPSANLNPQSFTKTMIVKNDIWGQRSQQDSSEYLLDLIDGLRAEQGSLKQFIGGRKLTNDIPEMKSKESLFRILTKQKEEEYCGEKYKFLTNMYSPFNKMFNFMVKTTKLCPNCKFTSHSIESTNVLKLDLPDNNKEDTLENLIINYSKSEAIDDENRVTCPSCIHKVCSESIHTIISLPQILIINLKRFSMNAFGMFGRKKQNRIIYPLELELTDIVNDGKEYKYMLVGVNMHLGYSINHGHYISIVKLSTDNGWHIFNDESNVRSVDNINQIVNNNATILFYLRKN